MPNPYLIVITLLATIGLTIGGYFYGTQVTRLAYEAQIADNSLKSEQAQEASVEAARKEERISAATSAKLESDHEKAQSTINSEHDRALATIDALSSVLVAPGSPGNKDGVPSSSPTPGSVIWPPPGCRVPRTILVTVADRERDADDVLAIARTGEAYAKVMKDFISSQPQP